MSRILLLVSCLLVIPLSGVLADSSGPSAPPFVLSVTPASAPATAPRALIGHGLPAGMRTPAVVFAPDGSQTPLVAATDGEGTLSLPLTPPGGFAGDGIYRVVLDLGIGQASSVLFRVGDDKPLLSAEPAVFSPYSALQIVGAGLPPNQGFDLVLTPANDRGDHAFPVSTDAGGFLQAYIWPQDLGETFFEAGDYRAAVPSLGLAVNFQVREKPTGPVLTVDGPALSDGSTPVHFRRYAPRRFLWTVYADASRRVRGEMLYGLTDPTGSLDVWAVFTGLEGGQYRLATPYDWGEATFTAIPPTPTPTATPTASATPTATPTATDPPSPTPVKTKKVCKRKHGKKRCKRVPVGPGL